ncbi:hypothetical protein MZM54_03565 [[Brevibacterium] frigoritolerans]|nr:hypothetical protein [Peribacillus frigoritolerans]
MRKHLYLFIILFLLLITSSCNNKETTKSVEKPIKEKREVYKNKMENNPDIIRYTEFLAEDEYMIDKDSLEYKTDIQGNFKAKYIYTNKTENLDSIDISIFIEGSSTPIHQENIKVKPNTSETVIINIPNLVNGEHIAYIITQYDKVDFKEKYSDKDYFSPYYFKIKVENNGNENTVKFEKTKEIKPLKIKKISAKEETYKIYVSDKEGNKIQDVEKNNHNELFLNIVNPTGYQITGYLYYYINGVYKNLKLNNEPTNNFVIEPLTKHIYKITPETNKGFFRIFSTYIPPNSIKIENSNMAPRLIFSSPAYLIK